MGLICKTLWDFWIVFAFALNAYWFGRGERTWIVYVGLVCCGVASLLICVSKNNK